MIAIALIRVVSAGVMGSEDQIWDVFWIYLEASVSVIAVCLTAFRSLFLIKNSPKDTPDKYDPNQAHVSVLRRIWGRKKPSLASINVGATLTGMITLIRGNGKSQLELQDDDGCALSFTEMRDTHSSQSLEATKRSMTVTHEGEGNIT